MGEHACVGWDENGLHRLIYLNGRFLVSRLFRKLKRCDLGGGVSLRVGFEVSKALTSPRLAL